MLVSYNWLKDYLGEDIPSVLELTELLTLHSFEIEEVTELANDTVIDIKVLPDRAGDCLSHRGIAREISTLINRPLVLDPFLEQVFLPETKDLVVTIADEENCSRFMLAHITDIEISPSPKWLQDRLNAIGQKSINNIVDATNYVMYALGQPMHAYDADLFAKTADNKWHFVIRKAKANETLALLKDSSAAETREVKLDGSELVIVDGAKNLPIGLAGVKGGEYASVNPDTTNIIIEAANFDSVLIRQVAKKHNINTDAVKRFENKPAEALPPLAINSIVALIKEIAGGNLEGVFDLYPNPTKSVAVSVRVDKVNKLLSLSLTKDEIKSILKRLGAEVKEIDDILQVIAPFERGDLVIEANYIEEVGRIYGLDKIVSIVPAAAPVTKINGELYFSQKIRSMLIDLGFSEVMTSTFRNKDEIQLQNSLASDKSFLRSSLSTGLDEALKQNIQNVDILGLTDIRIFEIGKVFKKIEGKIVEKLVLALGVQTRKTNHVPADDLIINEALTALAEIGIVSQTESKGGVCEIYLEDLTASLSLPARYDEVNINSKIIYKPFSLYPAIVRDVAMWVEEGVSRKEVIDIIENVAGSLCVRITLFDEFAKAGRVSYAFRLVFQSMNKTLTDAEVEPYMEAVYKDVSEAGFETR